MAKKYILKLEYLKMSKVGVHPGKVTGLSQGPKWNQKTTYNTHNTTNF